MNTVFSKLTVISALIVLSGSVWAKADLTGQWQVNQEETDKVTVKFEDGGGIKGRNFGRPQVSVGGLGLPIPRSYRQSANSSLPAKDPDMLRCNVMTIDQNAEEMLVKYDMSSKETVHNGNKRGRTGTWKKAGVEQKYKTPERRVTKTWELRDDGRMLITVKIKPRGDKSRTYKRVFDKVDPNAPITLEPSEAENPT